MLDRSLARAAAVSYPDLVAEDPSGTDEELARLRAKADDQGREIARLHDEASEASGEIAQQELRRTIRTGASGT
jgi:hypothetical protein